MNTDPRFSFFVVLMLICGSLGGCENRTYVILSLSGNTQSLQGIQRLDIECRDDTRMSQFKIEGNQTITFPTAVTLDLDKQAHRLNLKVSAKNAAGDEVAHGNGEIVLSGDPTQRLEVQLQTNPALNRLLVSSGSLDPGFSPDITTYKWLVPALDASITVTPFLTNDSAFAAIDGTLLKSGLPSAAIPLNADSAMLSIDVTQPGEPSRKYSFSITRKLPVYVKPSNTGNGNQFGQAVAVSGDTLAVGSPLEDSNATGINGNQNNSAAIDSGAVYVFTQNGGVWSQQAYIKASNTGSGGQFGSAVALEGDTLAVAAYGEDSNGRGVQGSQTVGTGTDSGAVYVFVRQNGIWTQQAYIKSSNSDPGDRFGTSLSLSGNTLVVGAHLEDSASNSVNGNQDDNSANASGAVYVFVRSGAVWSQQAYIKASNPEPSDNFGTSVSISGDLLAVGAPGEDSASSGVNGNQSDNSKSNSGSVYIFRRANSIWSQVAYLKASNPDTDDRFGDTVSLSGTLLAVDGSGEASSATGINGNQTSNAAAGSGCVYVFASDGNQWQQEAYIKASNTEAADSFGIVSLSGDTLAVGAFREDSDATGVSLGQQDNRAPDSGAVYLYRRVNGIWTQKSYIKAPNSESGDGFGYSLSWDGTRLAVGSFQEDSNATGIGMNQADNSAMSSGAVYLY